PKTKRCPPHSTQPTELVFLFSLFVRYFRFRVWGQFLKPDSRCQQFFEQNFEAFCPPQTTPPKPAARRPIGAVFAPFFGSLCPIPEPAKFILCRTRISAFT